MGEACLSTYHLVKIEGGLLITDASRQNLSIEGLALCCQAWIGLFSINWRSGSSLTLLAANR
jgi:hypothetical protein